MSLKTAGVIEIPGAAGSAFDHGTFDTKSRRASSCRGSSGRIQVAQQRDAVKDYVVAIAASDAVSARPRSGIASLAASPAPTIHRSSAAGKRRSDIRIGPGLCRTARMGHGAATRGAHLLGVFPQIS